MSRIAVELPNDLSDDEELFVECVFLGPNHGKSNWNGLTGIKKNQLRAGELNCGGRYLPLRQKMVDGDYMYM